MSPEVRRRRHRSRLRRVGRGLRRRPVVMVAGAVLGVLVVLGLWCLFVTLRTAGDLAEVERQGNLLRAELVDGDPDGAERALAAYQEAAESAASRTDGPTWWVAEHVPLLGDDAEGVATAARVLAGLGRDALPQLVTAARDVTSGAFQPEDHAFPLDTVRAAQEPAATSEAAFAEAAVELSDVESGGFIDPVAARFDELRQLVLESRSTLGSVYRAARLMPTLLGADGDRRYLLVLQNNAELRSTGGLPGSVSLLHAADGEVHIVEQQATARLGPLDRPVLPLTSEETDVFGRILGTYFRDANLTPDFPRTADLMATRWERDKGGRVDGVFMVDPVAVAYLLQATGPVAVPGFGQVDSTTVVQFVENQVYLNSADPEVHDDYQNAVAKAVFNAFADGRGEPAELIRGLVTGVLEGRVRMHSFERPVQAQVAGTAIAGEMPTDEPAMGVYLNDATASKMSYYLKYEVDLVARSCTGSIQDLSGSITLTNDTPADVDGLPPSVTGYALGREDTFVPGDQTVLLYLMTPGRGSLTELEIDEQNVPQPAALSLDGRSVVPVSVTLRPEETQTIRFAFRTGIGQTGDVELFVTPGSQTGTESRTVPSACASR